MEKKVQKIFEDNELSYDFDVCEDNIVIIHVLWGDWKHDHLCLDHIMRQNEFTLLHEEVTEEDGSDCYSSDHIYKLNAA